MMLLRRFLIAAAVASAALSPVAAHRGHDALTVVTVAANGALTVSHRFETSDIEPALAQIAPGAQPSLDDPEAVAALVAYLQRHFTVSSERGPIALVPGKTDLGASEVRISFTGTAGHAFRRLTLRGDMLGDIYPNQVNQVNVRAGATTRTVALSAGDSQTITIAPLPPARRKGR
jgi:hypothetical protein